MNDYQVTRIMDHVMEMSQGQIDEQKAVRDIIDYQYETTETFFYIQLVVYMCGYFLPLIYQISSTDDWTVTLCNLSCFIVQGYCLIYEAVTFYWDGKEYFKSGWNLLDCLNIVLYFIYFFVRIQNTGHAMPEIPENN